MANTISLCCTMVNGIRTSVIKWQWKNDNPTNTPYVVQRRQKRTFSQPKLIVERDSLFQKTE